MDEIRKRMIALWPDLGRDRIMTDDEVEMQAKRIAANKAAQRITVLCERCALYTAVPRGRYCKRCQIDVVRELKNCGYLQNTDVQYNKPSRSDEMKENTRETKFGYGNGEGH